MPITTAKPTEESRREFKEILRRHSAPLVKELLASGAISLPAQRPKGEG